MKKVEKYTGQKTYMYPNGVIATPERMLEDFPAILTFTHIIETDEAGEICWAVDNLSGLRSMYEIDPGLSVDEAIAKIEEIRNAKPEYKEPAPSVEERIAAALEFQNLMSL